MCGVGKIFTIFFVIFAMKFNLRLTDLGVVDTGIEGALLVPSVPLVSTGAATQRLE